jgi:hypothetical protein
MDGIALWPEGVGRSVSPPLAVRQEGAIHPRGHPVFFRDGRRRIYIDDYGQGNGYYEDHRAKAVGK